MTDIKKCRICGADMDTNDPLRVDCGGDCLLCMADAGDPDCIEAAYSYMRRAQKKNVRHFINLTNGIEAIADYGLDPHEVRFIRIQSTACEQKRWGDIIMQLSDDFLISAALGYHCVVYDYGANKEAPRAIWQGLEWVKYALWRRWYGCQYRPTGRAITMEPYFAEQYHELSPRVKARLDYFRRYCGTQLPHISAITGPTTHDGDKAYYVEALHAGVANLGEGR